VFLVLVCPLFSGCASYRIGDEHFSSSTAALDRQAELYAGILGQVQPMSSPVGGSALILLPSELEIRRNYIKYGPGTSPEDTNEALKFVVTSTHKNFQFMADAIRKRRLFDSVAVAFQDANPATYPIGEHDFLVFVDIDGWFVTDKGGARPRSVAMDRSRPVDLATLSTFLNGLERHASELRGK
jgi:hypothetical protein